MGIVVLIIILVFIVRVVSVSTSKKTRTNTDRKKDPEAIPVNQPKPREKATKPNQPNPREKAAKPNQPNPREKAAKPNQPKPREKATKPNQPKPRKKTTDGFWRADADDILVSARENNLEVRMENDKDMISHGDLMERVYELMVQGPEDSLSFQRDFVSEGMDMLNRYLS